MAAGTRGSCGAVRTCPEGAVLLLPDGDWQRLLAVRLVGGALVAADQGAMTGRALARAKPC